MTTDKNLLNLTAELNRFLKKDSKEFRDWVSSVDDKWWAKYDLSALRVGFEVGSKLHEDVLALKSQVVQLQSIIDGLWIDAKDQLPAREQKVLAIVDGKINYMCYTWMEGHMYWGQAYFSSDDVDVDHNYEVTCWMPIREPASKSGLPPL